MDVLQESTLKESHESEYSIHPSSTKMYIDLGDVSLWEVMKKDIVEFVAKCSNCQQVKVEHQRPRFF